MKKIKNQWRVYSVYSKKSRGFSVVIRGGLTVFISVLIIFTVVQAGSLTPPASPAATMHSLSDIAGTNFITATHSLKAIYDAVLLRSSHSAADIWTQNTRTLTVADWTTDADTAQLKTDLSTVHGAGTWATATGFSVHSVADVATDVWTEAARTITGGSLTTPGDYKADVSNLDVAVSSRSAHSAIDVWTEAARTLTDAASYKADVSALALDSEIGAAADAAAMDTTLFAGQQYIADNMVGTYDSSGFSADPNGNIMEQLKFIREHLGGYTYGSNISGLDATACSAASWTWVADSNYDLVNDDPICVQPNRDAVGTKVWNTSAGNDNTFIGNYSCSDSGDNLETFDAQLDGKVVENANYGDDANVALAIADCKDGIRHLLSKAAVETHGYTAIDVDCTAPDYDDCYNGPLNPKALLEWRGTRLPSYNDFFGVCGNATTSKIWGRYGTQIGRVDNVVTANIGSWEWFSGQRSHNSARVGGGSACSYFHSNPVTTTYGFRVVFRP